jgi:hypothetical protein
VAAATGILHFVMERRPRWLKLRPCNTNVDALAAGNREPKLSHNPPREALGHGSTPYKKLDDQLRVEN